MSSKSPPSDVNRCAATSRQTGKRCKLKAIPPSKFCFYHGAHSLGNKHGKGVPKGTPKPPGAGGPPPKGNANALTHGAYTSKMPPEMKQMRESLLIRYMRAVDNPTEVDQRTVERVATLDAKLAFALDDPECPASTLDTLTRLLHLELKSLKLTRVQQETSSSGTTPVEVIAAIMKKVEARRKQLAERGRLEAPMPAPSRPVPARREVIDVEPVVHEDPDPDPEPPPIDVELEEEEPGDRAPDCDDDCDDDDATDQGPDPDAAEAVAASEDDADWWPED